MWDTGLQSFSSHFSAASSANDEDAHVRVEHEEEWDENAGEDSQVTNDVDVWSVGAGIFKNRPIRAENPLQFVAAQWELNC